MLLVRIDRRRPLAVRAMLTPPPAPAPAWLPWNRLASTTTSPVPSAAPPPSAESGRAMDSAAAHRVGCLVERLVEDELVAGDPVRRGGSMLLPICAARARGGSCRRHRPSRSCRRRSCWSRRSCRAGAQRDAAGAARLGRAVLRYPVVMDIRRAVDCVGVVDACRSARCGRRGCRRRRCRNCRRRGCWKPRGRRHSRWPGCRRRRRRR